MSYRGYTEYLCEKGHYRAVDCYEDHNVNFCSECGSGFAYRHDVDCTNGEIEGSPGTMPAELELIDRQIRVVEMTIYSYAPAGGAWRKIAD